MLTGSFALAHYATPRMTRDLDIVIALEARDVEPLVAAFADDFYIDPDDVRAAIASARLFNLMHFGSGIKVDLILSKLVWARDAQSELQRRDVVALLAGSGLDGAYLRTWSARLGVSALLEELWC